MFENPRRGRQARNFATNVPKILVLKSSFERIFSRKLPLGAPDYKGPGIINILAPFMFKGNIIFVTDKVNTAYLIPLNNQL